MTIDEARTELRNYRLDRISYLDEIEEELRLRAKAEGVTTSYEARFGNKTNKSQVEEYAVLLVQHADEMDKTLITEENRLQAMREAIHRLPNPYKQILIERYLHGSSLKKTAAILDRDYFATSKLHAWALRLYCELRNKDTGEDSASAF